MTKVTEEDIAIMTRLYERGMSPYEISEVFGGKVSHAQVRNKLIGAGVQMRSLSEAKRNPKVPDIDQLKKEYLEEEKSCYAIGKKYGVAASVIWHRLNKAGVPMKEISKERKERTSAVS